jgi:uncharacterized protein (DUF488 family)
MESSTGSDGPTLFTIGHSNHSFEAFVQLLRTHRIQLLVDTRSSPYSRYVAHFNREEIARAFSDSDVEYVFLGRELGGRPEDDEFYDDVGHVLYDRLAASFFFQRGIAQLEEWMQQSRVAILCSEEDPATCHRYLLISRVLRERGVSIRHLRGDGSIQEDADVATPAHRQLFLFDVAEERPWKSLRPIPRRKRVEHPPDDSGVSPPNDDAAFD